MNNVIFDFRANAPKYEAMLENSSNRFRGNPKGMGIYALKAAAEAQRKKSK